MPDVKRVVRIVTNQKIKAGQDENANEGFPMRDWNIEIFIRGEDGSSLPAMMYEKALYKLHPTFGDKANQTKKQQPFRIDEEGWGEFDMSINLTVLGKPSEVHVIQHDLNFASERYEAEHPVTFKNPKAELLAVLRDSGPVPGEENGIKKTDAMKKRARANKNFDIEKLADGLQKLGEDDLLHVVELVHTHKTEETYTKNDVENGEFHVDLYTLSDPLVKMLWDFCTEKGTL